MNCCCIILSYWYHQEMHWWMKRHKFCKALIFFNQTGFSFATSISLKSTVGWKFKKVPPKVYVQSDPVKAWNFFQNVLNFIFWCLLSKNENFCYFGLSMPITELFCLPIFQKSLVRIPAYFWFNLLINLRAFNFWVPEISLKRKVELNKG